MPTPMAIYSENMDWLRKEFSLPETTSLYEILNLLVDKYKVLKTNQTTKEPEDGKPKRTRSKNG